ncbi:MAG: hypothetical protein ACUZ8H_15570 [Candidatus Anammoxibacter sp.]
MIAKLIEIDGKEMTVSEWAAHSGLKASIIHCRIGRGVKGSDLIKVVRPVGSGKYKKGHPWTNGL